MSDPVFLFPGQGSQYLGMGKSLLERYSPVQRLFAEASDLLNQDFAKLCAEGPETILAETQNVQPAITLVNLSVAAVLQEEGITPSAAAGHSLGEYSALCAAGTFSFADTLRLVHFRGQAMKAAADQSPGGMVAVFGLDLEAAKAVCEESKSAGSVEVANQNSPAQVVLTGDREGLKLASELAKKRGAKLLVPLKVSGPWHSRFMAEAQAAMAARLAECRPSAPAFPVVANRIGREYPADAEGIRRLLLEQIVSPVLWSDSISYLVKQGHRLFVEVGPGQVLTGLMKDISRDAKAMNVQDLDTLARFQAFRSATLAV
jgi:[acyl-carrier-protein] S-malonyltransferase